MARHANLQTRCVTLPFVKLAYRPGSGSPNTPANTHEDFRRSSAFHGGSDRSFGLVFAGVFAAIALWPFVHQNRPRLWALALGIAFFLVALVDAPLLNPLNRGWAKVGQLLSKITNPIISGLMFFLLFTPAGLLFRILGKDPLRLKFDKAASSYWLARQPPGPAPETMRNQF